VQITMAITRFEDRKKVWDSGEDIEVNSLKEFNEQQFWTREVLSSLSLCANLNAAPWDSCLVRAVLYSGHTQGMPAPL
jgi:hypothetical protein